MTAPTVARPNRRGMLTGSDMRSCCTLNWETAMVIECGSGHVHVSRHHNRCYGTFPTCPSSGFPHG